MAGLGKIDIACIAFMVVITLTISGYMAVYGSWAVINDVLIWMGWVWWVIIGIVIVSLLIIILSSRRSAV